MCFFYQFGKNKWNVLFCQIQYEMLLVKPFLRHQQFIVTIQNPIK